VHRVDRNSNGDMDLPPGDRPNRLEKEGEAFMVHELSVWRTHFRSASAERPIFPAIDRIASHWDPYSALCSRTIRPARSPTSSENLFLRAMIQSSQ